ncbi:MAG: trigger factor, partial [Spirochaetales bacterium]|nr:trigger factor [Spirochaetales bacterium]
MEKDEEKIIEKNYPEDHEDSHLAGKKITLKVTVKAVKQRDIPELDDDFAQDISEEYETLQDLKDDISKRLQNDLDQKLKEYKINQIINQIIEKTPFDIPNSMIQAQLEDSWKHFAQNSGIPEEQLEQILQMQGKTKQNIMDEWKDQAVNSIKSTLIINKIIENEQLDASDEDLEKLKEEKKDQLPEDPQQQKYMEYMQKEQIKSDKAADLLLDSAVVKTGEKKSYKEFMQNTVD